MEKKAVLKVEDQNELQIFSEPMAGSAEEVKKMSRTGKLDKECTDIFYPAARHMRLGSKRSKDLGIICE